MAHRRKILIVNANQFGYHTDHYNFAKYLSLYFDVHFVCFDRGRDRVQAGSTNVVYLPFPRVRLFRASYFFVMTLRYIRHQKFDVLLADYFMLVMFLGLMSNAKMNMLDIRSGSLRRNPILRRLENLNMLLASLCFDKVTVISDGLARQLKVKGYKLLPLGSDIFFAGSHSFEDLRLLYVGSFNQRNIQDTIEGLSIFISIHPDVPVKYSIVGFGEDSEITRIEKTIQTTGLQDVVTYHGRKVNDQLRPFFTQSNVGVSYVPITPWYDNQPATKTFEYILSGMICIATATSENRKFLNENNGVLCKDNPKAFAEALGEVWEKRKSFRSQDVRHTLSDYTWERIVETKLKPELSTAWL